MMNEQEESLTPPEYWAKCMAELTEKETAVIKWANGNKRQKRIKMTDSLTGDVHVHTTMYSEDGECTGFFWMKNGNILI